MTLDGKLATSSGDSKWISGDASRRIAHELRGRMDAILVGRGTAVADDPLLTARPPGPRIAARIVLDSNASLPSNSQLVRTAADAPLMVVVSERAASSDCKRLSDRGCEVFVAPGDTPAARIDALLRELGSRGMTNILVEGGGTLLGSLFDEQAVDEVHVFVAPKIVGGAGATTPVGGHGIPGMAAALQLTDRQISVIEQDLYIHGRCTYGTLP
jgi:diaminohydroxyphosphoribosylaminopyrimidine deaminase/5-amino-6-(5-phosphoribosylamino)uracil reductase